VIANVDDGSPIQPHSRSVCASPRLCLNFRWLRRPTKFSISYYFAVVAKRTVLFQFCGCRDFYCDGDEDNCYHDDENYYRFDGLLSIWWWIIIICLMLIIIILSMIIVIIMLWLLSLLIVISWWWWWWL
jgi:hypothetical protein